MAVVSVSLETDTTATNRELPGAQTGRYTNRARYRGCRPRAAALGSPVLEPARAGASKSRQSASDAHASVSEAG